MRFPYETPSEECPYCGANCTAEFVDIGVGMQQAGPYVCDECHAIEAGPFDARTEDVDANTGWYPPDGWEPSETDQGLIPIPEGYNEQ